MFRFIYCFGAFAVLHSSFTSSAEVTYIGAVLEYEPYSISEDGFGDAVLMSNALAIADYAVLAKGQGADILVAPEYGIQSLDMNKTDFNAMVSYMQYVPDPQEQIAPCNATGDAEHISAMQIISCASLRDRIYIVIDLGEMEPCTEETIANSPWPSYTATEQCPENGFIFYNTQAVFDRNGIVVARYRKKNLFLEPHFTPGTEDDESALFVTDFNVLFSLQVCFDIVFEHPGYHNVLFNDVYDVAMSTAWVDELPFFLANNVQNGWSRGLGVNLLVSGYHKPERTKLGSGVFRGYSKDSPMYTYDKDSGNVLVVAPVTTNEYIGTSSRALRMPSSQESSVPKEDGMFHPNKQKRLSNEEGGRTHNMLHIDMSEFAHQNLEEDTGGEMVSTNLCSTNGEICCYLDYQNSDPEIYKLVAHSGFISVGDGAYSVAFQICSVVWCRSSLIDTCGLVELGVPTNSTFGPFSLSASDFLAEEIYPGGLHTNLLLVDNELLKFEQTSNTYTISSDETIDNPLCLGLLGRWYSNVPNVKA